MSITEAILSLLSDDRYLLYEVLGSSEVQENMKGRSFSHFLHEVNVLIDQGAVICTSGPLIGGAGYSPIQPEVAKKLLDTIDAWAPPKDDVSDTVWLELGDVL